MYKFIAIVIIILVFTTGAVCTAYTKETDFIDAINNALNINSNDDTLSGSSVETEDNVDDNDILENFYNNMPKAEFKNQEYGWVDECIAERPDFIDGVIGGKVKDFDSDGVNELLVVSILNTDNEYEGIYDYTTVRLNMYELSDNNIQLADSTEDFVVINSGTDAGGLECFMKDNYIVLECAIQNNTFADGANNIVNIYSYENSRFETVYSFNLSGSSIMTEDKADTKQNLINLGFAKTAEYFNDEIVSPYFIGYDYETNNWGFDYCFNIAKIENAIDPITELLVINNLNDVIASANNIDDWNEFLITNCVMKIEFKNFFDIK